MAQLQDEELPAIRVLAADASPDTCLEDVVKAYLWLNTTNMEDLIDGSSMFIMCNIGGANEDKNEYWTSILIQNYGNFAVVLFEDCESCDWKDRAVRKLQEALNKKLSALNFCQLTLKYRILVNDGTNSVKPGHVSTALMMLEKYTANLTLLQSDKNAFREQFQECAFFSEVAAEKFERLVVEVGLLEDLRTKPTLSKILKSLSNILDRGNSYCPADHLLTNLSNKLCNKTFWPRKGDDENLLIEIIRLLCFINDKKADCEKGFIRKRLEAFFTSAFSEEIDKWDNSLESNPLDDKKVSEMLDAVKSSAELLVHVCKFDPSINLIDAIEMLMTFLSDGGRLNISIGKRERCDTDLLRLSERREELMNEQLGNPATGVIRITKEILELKEQVKHIQTLIHYWERKVELSQSIDFDDLIILYSEQKTTAIFGISELRQSTVRNVLSIGRRATSEKAATAVVTILDLAPNNTIDINSFDNIVAKISPRSNPKIVINLVVSEKLKPGSWPGFIQFLHRILVENEDASHRQEALQALNHFADCNDYARVLEMNCVHKSSELMQNCLAAVNSGKHLTFHCFQSMDLHHTHAVEVIAKCIKISCQRPPVFFIKNCTQFIVANLNENAMHLRNALNIAKILIAGRFIRMKDIVEIARIMRNTQLQNECLEIVLLAIGSDQEIPSAVVEILKSLPPTLFALNLLKSSTQQSSADALPNTSKEINILKDVTKTLNERKLAMGWLIKKVSKTNALDVIRMLQDLVEHDESIRTAAFHSLAHVLPNNNFFTAVDFEATVQCLYDSRVQIDDIAVFAWKNMKEARLAQIVRLITHQMSLIDDSEKIDAVKQLRRITSRFGKTIITDDSISFMTRAANSATNATVSNLIIEFLLEYIPETNFVIYTNFLAHGLKNLEFSTSEQRQQTLQSLKRARNVIQAGYIVTDDTILILLNCLKVKTSQEISNEILEIFSVISDNQDMSDNVVLQLHKICKCPDYSKHLEVLFNLRFLVARVVFKLNPDNSRLMKELWICVSRVLDDSDSSPSRILLNIKNAMLKTSPNPPQFVFNKIAKIFLQESDVPSRIIAAEIVHSLLPQYSDCLRKLIGNSNPAILVGPSDVRNKQDWIFNRLVAEIFIEIEGFDDILKQFAQKCCDQFLLYLSRVSGELSETDASLTRLCYKPIDILRVYFQKESVCILDKLNLSSSIFNIISNGDPLDLTVLQRFDDTKWRSEILCVALLCRIYRSSSFNGRLDEFELGLQSFGNNILSLHEFLIEQQQNKDEKYSLANVLEALYCLPPSDIETLNDILVFVQSVTKALEIIIRNANISVVDLQKVWLEKQLTDQNIAHSEESLNELNDLLCYRGKLLSGIFGQINATMTMHELTRFFRDLSCSCISNEEKEDLLAKLVFTEPDIDVWRSSLFTIVVKLLIDDTFLGHQHSDISRVSRAAKGTTELRKIRQKHDYKTSENLRMLSCLSDKLVFMMTNGWAEKLIKQIINYIYSPDVLKGFLASAIVISEYCLREFHCNVKGKSVMNLIRNTNIEKLETEIHQLAIFNTFQASHDKTLAQLIEEIIGINNKSGNSNSDHLRFLSEEFEKVMQAYDSSSRFLNSGSTPIKYFNHLKIKQWVNELRTRIPVASVYEKIAVVKRAIELSSGFPLRDVQLLSLLILLNDREDKSGRLAQINTGEGKTTVIAALAVLKALDGHKVDIITSSSELAKPQSQQQRNFYEQFDLTVAHNCDESNESPCYDADIVYGAAGNFQGDILGDELSQLNKRRGRKCKIAIVDEVDSMLIDSRNHIVMLSSPMPAMDNLEPILAAIWIQIELVASRLQEIHYITYFIEDKDKIGDDGLIDKNVGHSAVRINCTKEEFIRRCTDIHIRKALRMTKYLPEDNNEIDKDYPELKVPSHLAELLEETQIQMWIDSAIYAKYKCMKDMHYILEDGKVLPVDAVNTGVVQQNMLWNKGLHQFLQIKHGAKITAESLTTNFISNVAYFQRYSKLYGVTGTLGGANAVELLNNTYNVDSVYIPPFRQKRHKELAPIVTKNESDWYSSILESTLSKLRNGRAVLLILKYIKEVNVVKDKFVKDFGYKDASIKVYQTERDSDTVQAELKSGELIIATNIAGRGTDIKCGPSVEKNGGLHVCITFLPKNQRIDLQNAGRTSRTGNRGTSQFIVLDKHGCSVHVQSKTRDKHDESYMTKAVRETDNILKQEKVFEKFRQLLNRARGWEFKNKDLRVRGVEERFGTWLQMQHSIISQGRGDELLANFKLFEEEILKDRQSDQVINNSYFYVLSGNQSLSNKDYLHAIQEYTTAIVRDKDFAEHAFYNRGYARIAVYGGDALKNKQEIDNAIVDFKDARRLIEERELQLHIIQRASSSPCISEQVLHKMTLFGVQKSAIDNAIGTGVGSVDKEIEILEEEKRDTRKQDDKDLIDKQIDGLKRNRYLRENGIIGMALRNGRNVTIKLVGIESSLPGDQDIKRFKDEIKEHRQNGAIGSFVVSEIVPINWGLVIALASIGVAQLVIGAALAVFTLGAGSTIGMGLMSGGVSDLITMVKDCIINRDFSWAAWGIEKAISMTVSVVCAGLKAIKDVAKTAYSAAKQVATAAVKVGTTTVKKGWMLAAKALGTSIAKGVANELITDLVYFGVSRALMPIIRDEICNMIEKPIEDGLLANPKIQNLLQIDRINGDRHNYDLIKRLAFEILNEKSEMPSLARIASGIALGIASQKIKGAHAAFQVISALKATGELSLFVPEFIHKLIDKVSKTVNDEDVVSQLNNKVEHSATHWCTNSVSTPNTETDIDLQVGKLNQEQVKASRNTQVDSELSIELSQKVSLEMNNIIQGKLISPIAHNAAAMGINSLMSELDQQIQNEIGDYQAERRIQFSQSRDKQSRIGSEYKRGEESSEQLSKAADVIDELEAGGEAGLYHLGPLSEAIRRPIVVLNEKGRIEHNIGSYKDGEPIRIQYHKPGNENSTGHWTLPDGREPSVANIGTNNCLFNVVAEQVCGLDAQMLRFETARVMNNNIGQLANQIKDIEWLKTFKSRVLSLGGAQFSGKHPGDVAAYFESTGGYLNEKCHGHARKHAVCHNAASVCTSAGDCIQSYSEIENKTGFLSRKQQDEVGFLTLTHKESSKAMAELNRLGSQGKLAKATVTIPVSELGAKSKIGMETWKKGGLATKCDAGSIKIVLQHQKGKERDAAADVHILTMYPVKKVNERSTVIESLHKAN